MCSSNCLLFAILQVDSRSSGPVGVLRSHSNIKGAKLGTIGAVIKDLATYPSDGKQSRNVNKKHCFINQSIAASLYSSLQYRLDEESCREKD
ncbi:hypothetical protein R6Q59_008662 [Mikania micrantha]